MIIGKNSLDSRDERVGPIERNSGSRKGVCSVISFIENRKGMIDKAEPTKKAIFFCLFFK